MIPKSLMSAMDQDSELSMETGFAVKMLCLFGKGVPHPLVPRNCPPVRNLAYEIAINWTDGMMDLSTGHGQPQTQGAQQILGVALGGGKNGSYGLRMVYMCL